MAVIETPAETVDAAADPAQGAGAGPTGLAAVLGSADHKVIGRLYAASALVMALPVLVVGLALAVEGVEPDKLNLLKESYVGSTFTFFRVGLLLLVALPLVIGVGLIVTPLQVGARAAAFPRAAAASYWAWLVGAILLIASYLLDGGPGGGRASAVDLWIAAMGVLLLAVLTAAVSLATTVLALRTDGLTLARTPLFAWSVLVASVVWLLTLPVLVGQLVLIYVDHKHGGSSFAGDKVFFSQLGWIFRNPQAYAVAIPALGFAADVMITSSGRRLVQRTLALGAISTFGVLSFGAFLASGSDKALESPVTVILGLFATVPLLLVLALAGDAFRKAAINVSAGFLYAFVAMLVLLLATVGGAIGSVPSLNTGGTIYDIGVSHAASLAAIIAGLGGLHWWATKVFGRPAKESAGRLAPLMLLLGAAAIVIPDLVSGLFGEGAEVTPDWTGGMKAMNVIIVIGAVMFGLGMLLAIAGVLTHDGEDGDDVPADPWGGQTLEWLTASPPSLANFDEPLAAVTSAEPAYDLREEN